MAGQGLQGGEYWEEARALGAKIAGTGKSGVGQRVMVLDVGVADGLGDVFALHACGKQDKIAREVRRLVMAKSLS